MRFTSVVCLLATSSAVDAFVVKKTAKHLQRSTPVSTVRLQSTAESIVQEEAAPNSKAKTTKLGLLTFDLDDTLYPLAPVIEEANEAFSRAMEKYGFPGIQPADINSSSIQIRQEMAKSDPQAAAILSHTEVRKLAIRKEMEAVMLQRKLEDCASDWATNVDSLGPAVVESAKKCVDYC